MYWGAHFDFAEIYISCHEWRVKHINSSEAKASRVIIYKFPVKLPFPDPSIVGSREPRSPDKCIPMVSCTAGIPSSAHVSMNIHSIQYSV